MSAFEYANVVTQTGATRTLEFKDSGSIIVATVACAFTLPSGLGVGFNVAIISPAVPSSIVGASGVTINNGTAPVEVKAGFSGVSIISLDANKFAASGNLPQP